MPTSTSVPWLLSWSMCVPTVKININDSVFFQGGRVYQGDHESPVCIPCAFHVHSRENRCDEHAYQCVSFSSCVSPSSPRLLIDPFGIPADLHWIRHIPLQL